MPRCMKTRNQHGPTRVNNRAATVANSEVQGAACRALSAASGRCAICGRGTTLARPPLRSAHVGPQYPLSWALHLDRSHDPFGKNFLGRGVTVRDTLLACIAQKLLQRGPVLFDAIRERVAIEQVLHLARIAWQPGKRIA